MFLKVWLGHLILLEVSGNPIHTIHSSAFSSLLSIPLLNLSRLGLSDLEKGSFKNVRNLHTLDISKNNLEELTVDTLRHLSSLRNLDMKENNLKYISGEILLSLPSMTYIGADDRRLCCIASNVQVCDAPGDTLSTCKDLLSKISLRICVIIISLASFLFNMWVLYLRLFSQNTDTSQNET